MNKVSRERLFKAVAPRLEQPFYMDEDDEFVNVKTPRSGFVRVFRVIGDKRRVMRFLYPHHDPFGRWPRDYDIQYLTSEGSWAYFVPAQIYMEALDANPSRYSYDKIVGEWLSAHDAKAFTGNGWDSELSDLLTTVWLDEWKKIHEPWVITTPAA